MKNLFSLVAVSILLFALVPFQCFAKDAEVKLRVHHFLPVKATAHTQLIKPWSDRVMAESGGRIEVEIYPSMQLGGKPPQLYEQVKDGVVDVAWTLAGYTPGRFPITELFELPFIAGTAEATTQALQEFSTSYLKKEYRAVHPLLFHVHAPGNFHMVSKQIKSMEDLSGMKVRTPTSSVTNALKALGASPVGMPVPEVPQALATEVIDGAVLPWEVVRALRVQEMTKFHTEVGTERGFYTAVFVFAMNQDKYNSLPADLKKVIDNNSGMNIAKQIGQAWDAAELPAIEFAKQRGNTLNSLPPEEVKRWEQATQPVVDAWVEKMDKKGLNGSEMLETARRLITKYSGK